MIIGRFSTRHAASPWVLHAMAHLTSSLSSARAAQVYLGKWHSSEVAIKCLNPSLFFSGSDGTASKAAMADLLREADLLASLRHPNVVWVYGVVLPRMVRSNLSDLPCTYLLCLVCPFCLMLAVDLSGPNAYL